MNIADIPIRFALGLLILDISAFFLALFIIKKKRSMKSVARRRHTRKSILDK
jgi:hypothetical protein